MRKPNFFIVGAPKCGTTSMYHYLRQHPDVYMPKYRKEPHFFVSDFPSIKFKQGLEEYLDLFAEAQDEKRVGEATSWYLFSKKAAEEIKVFSPDSKIIIMLRNPVDMMYSLHSQWLFSGNEEVEDFSVALSYEEDRRKGERLPKYCYFQEGLYYREVVKYSEQVKRYYDVFGKENVHVIIFDDLIKDVEKVYREVLLFLGVDAEFKGNFDAKNPNTRSRFLFLTHLLRNPPSFVSLILKRIVNSEARQKIGKTVGRLNAVQVKRTPIDADVRGMLLDEMAVEIQKLGKLLGRDLDCWVQGSK